MINANDSRLGLVTVHHVPQHTPAALSVSEVRPVSINDDRLHGALLQMLTDHFKSDEAFQFMEGSIVKEWTAEVLDAMEDVDAFTLVAQKLAARLYASSTHADIPAGDLFIAQVSGIWWQESQLDALVVWKAEAKNPLLVLGQNQDQLDLALMDGYLLSKPQKGALILNTKSEDGPTILITDTGKRPDAKYWTDSFLGIARTTDEFQFTRNVLAMTHSFVADRMPEQFELARPDQIDLLNRSINYFKENEMFNEKEFSTEVFRDPVVIDSYNDYRKQTSVTDDLPVTDQFAISQQAVKAQSRTYKSILKLDKNFHIYIHGNRNLIEGGFDDEKGMRYYKVFFKEEA